MENIDQLKHTKNGKLTYKLANANVYVSPGGFHYIDYLDPVEEIPPEISVKELSPDKIAYIERALQSNPERFAHQVEVVKQHIHPHGKKALDIGSGGGLFLSLLRDEGADVTGIELSDERAYYAQKKHKLPIVKRLIEDDYWQVGYKESFDIVSLWDVIEHVNFPQATLQAAANVLKPGGFLFIDTPCRDAFYHRVGSATYRLSRGRFPTFLNAMYSAHRFGHKQIFAIGEMEQLLENLGFEVVYAVKLHELSFPHSFYLRKMVPSETLVKALLPFVSFSLSRFPVKNKMMVVGRKK